MVRTQIQLTEEQARAIKRIANVQGVSIAEVIRRAIDRIINAGPTVDIGERHKRALEIVGKFRSGRRNVSRKHDAHLAETFGK